MIWWWCVGDETFACLYNASLKKKKKNHIKQDSKISLRVFFWNLQRTWTKKKKKRFFSSVSILFFLAANGRRQPAANTDVQRETTRGKSRGVKRSGNKKPVMWGEFPRAAHLPSVPTPQDACEPSCAHQRTRATIRFVETTKPSHVARPGSLLGAGERGASTTLPLSQQSVSHSTLRRVSQDSTWHVKVLLFMSRKKN